MKKLLVSILVPVGVIWSFIYLHDINLFIKKNDHIPQVPPVDISFLIADVKYNEQQGVKICEIQPANFSTFNGYDFSLEAKGLLAEPFCAVLNQYQNNIWMIERHIADKHFIEQSKKLGCKTYKTEGELFDDQEILNNAFLPVKDPFNIRDYHGFLYSALVTKPYRKREFKKKYPGIILIDDAISEHIGNKQQVNALLSSDKSLKRFKPKWASYRKIYKKNLANKILKDIQSDIVVLKPIDSTNSRGVIATHKDDLDDTLKKILTNRSDLGKDSERSYRYWARDFNNHFLVEEFVPSIPISLPLLENAMYDFTIRILLMLIYDQGETKIVFLGNYWKLPEKSLDEEGSLTEKYITGRTGGRYTKTQPEIQQKVEAEVVEAVSLLYHKILSKT